jgi:hypothetical protein
MGHSGFYRQILGFIRAMHRYNTRPRLTSSYIRKLFKHMIIFELLKSYNSIWLSLPSATCRNSSRCAGASRRCDSSRAKGELGSANTAEAMDELDEMLPVCEGADVCVAPGTTLRGLPLFLAGITTGASGAELRKATGDSVAAADEKTGGEDEDRVEGSAVVMLHSIFTVVSRIASGV